MKFEFYDKRALVHYFYDIEKKFDAALERVYDGVDKMTDKDKSIELLKLSEVQLIQPITKLTENI